MEEIDRVRVLLIEDSEEDATWIKMILRKAENVTFDIDHVDWLSNATTALINRTYDVILLDLGLPDSLGLETLTEIQKVAGATPIIVLTGHDEMRLAMDCMEGGAQDFQLKSDVKTRPLERAILYAIKRRHHETIGKDLINASMSTFGEDDIDTPKLALIRAHVNKIPEAIDEIRGYLRRNAPNAYDDVDSILAAHNMTTVIKEIRDIVAPKNRQAKSTVQNMAHQTLSNIQAATTPVPKDSVPPMEARETLLQAMEELKAPIGEDAGE
jgi:DNA-binding response OmpR family regulator